MAAVQGRVAVAVGIVILDVIVDQRRLVKDLDRQRRAIRGVGQGVSMVRTVGKSVAAASHGVESGQSDKGSQVLAATAEEIEGNGSRGGDWMEFFGRGLGFAHAWQISLARPDQPPELRGPEHLFGPLHQLQVGPRSRRREWPLGDTLSADLRADRLLLGRLSRQSRCLIVFLVRP